MGLKSVTHQKISMVHSQASLNPQPSEGRSDETNWLASNLQLAYWIKYSSGGLIIPTPYTTLDE